MKHVKELHAKWHNARELGSGQPSIVMQAIAGELATAILADEAELPTVAPEDEGGPYKIEAMRIGRPALEALRSQLTHQDAARLTDWEVVEIGADELKRAREQIKAAEDMAAHRAEVLQAVAALRPVLPNVTAHSTDVEVLAKARTHVGWLREMHENQAATIRKLREQLVPEYIDALAKGVTALRKWVTGKHVDRYTDVEVLTAASDQLKAMRVWAESLFEVLDILRGLANSGKSWNDADRDYLAGRLEEWRERAHAVLAKVDS